MYVYTHTYIYTHTHTCTHLTISFPKEQGAMFCLELTTSKHQRNMSDKKEASFKFSKKPKKIRPSQPKVFEPE